MKKIDINALIQLLGMAGIIGSLIFVGLEMRQTQRIAIAAQIQERYSKVSDYHISLMTEGEVARDLIRRGVYTLDLDVLTPDEQATLIQIKNFFINQWQSIVAQYELGLIPQDVWEQTADRIKIAFAQCDWRPNFSSVTAGMNDYLDSLPSDCEA